MGADLYIKNMERQKQYLLFEVSDKAINLGYFRDCYNSEGLFAVMSQTLNKTISWWKMSDEIGLNKNSLLPFTKVKKWKETMFPLLEEFKKHTDLYYKDYKTDSNKKIEDQKQIKEYHDWADKLMKFIDLAIEKKAGIVWSV